MTSPRFSDDDVGKPVVRANGHTVGRVVEVRDGTPYVEPDPGILDTVRATLGWGDPGDEEAFPLRSEQIDSVTDDEIRLGGMERQCSADDER
jgi:hypothetical protein